MYYTTPSDFLPGTPIGPGAPVGPYMKYYKTITQLNHYCWRLRGFSTNELWTNLQIDPLDPVDLNGFKNKTRIP